MEIPVVLIGVTAIAAIVALVVVALRHTLRESDGIDDVVNASRRRGESFPTRREQASAAQRVRDRCHDSRCPARTRHRCHDLTCPFHSAVRT